MAQLLELAIMIFGPAVTREQVETVRHEMHHHDME